MWFCTVGKEYSGICLRAWEVLEHKENEISRVTKIYATRNFFFTLTAGTDGKRNSSLLTQAYSQVDINLSSQSADKEFE